MTKMVFVINGSGGVGKDTICQCAAQFWRVRNISSITPILQVARVAGWNGEKTPQARLFLSNLKAACAEFNDLPYRYCMEQYEQFLRGEEELLFVHIREAQEIDRFLRGLHTPHAAVLVRRAAFEMQRGKLGNESDDNVLNYDYDYVLDNDGPLEQLPEQIHHFFTTIIKEIAKV